MDNPKNDNQQEQPFYGEDALSGTTPDPESDDDTLENAHNVGEQLKEDYEHPQEIDISRDVNESESKIRGG